MSSLYDEEFEVEESEILENDEEYDENNEDYEPGDEKEPVGEEEFVLPTIYAGKEQLRTWNADAAGGIKSTTFEGNLGRKHTQLIKNTRTPEERFRDNIERAASSENAQVDSGTVKAVISLIPKIPDIQYKSPAGCLLGYLLFPYLGKNLNSTQKSAADKIMDKTKLIKDKRLQIFPLDVIRYARAWQLWIHGKTA